MSFRQWRAYVLAPKISNWKDKLCRLIVWRLMPRRLVNWAGVRMMAHATHGKWQNQVVPELLAMDVLSRWNDEERNDDGKGSDSEIRRRGSGGSIEETTCTERRRERGAISTPIYASPQNWQGSAFPVR